MTQEVPVMGFHSIKGGVGRSTLMAHQAIFLATRGLKVLMIDADFEGPNLDGLLRTDPTILGMIDALDKDHESYSKDGSTFDELLVNNGKATQAKLIDVAAVWKNDLWNKHLESTLLGPAPASASETVLDKFEDIKGKIKDTGGQLFLLPCSYTTDILLTIPYNKPGQLASTAINVIQGIAESKNIDIALIDLRNGMSDAASILGNICDWYINVTAGHYSHNNLIPPYLDWLWLQNWNKKCILAVRNFNNSDSVENMEMSELMRYVARERFLRQIKDPRTQDLIKFVNYPHLESAVKHDCVLVSYNDKEQERVFSSIREELKGDTNFKAKIGAHFEGVDRKAQQRAGVT